MVLSWNFRGLKQCLEGSVDCIICRDYIMNRSSFIFCSLANLLRLWEADGKGKGGKHNICVQKTQSTVVVSPVLSSHDFFVSKWRQQTTRVRLKARPRRTCCGTTRATWRAIPFWGERTDVNDASAPSGGCNQLLMTERLDNQAGKLTSSDRETQSIFL